MSVPIRRIMVTLDGSELAKAALPYAQLLASQAGAELTLLRVAPNITPRQYMKEHLPYNQEQMEAEQFDKIESPTLWLQDLADSLRLHHIQAVPAVEVGDAADKIVQYAKVHEIDLIIMSTHGHTGLHKLLAGSVASKVSTSAPCPVLLVRSPA